MVVLGKTLVGVLKLLEFPDGLLVKIYTKSRAIRHLEIPIYQF